MTRIRQLDFTREEKARLRTYCELVTPHRPALFLEALGVSEPPMEVETELRIERQAIFEDAWVPFAERLAERGRA